MAREAGAFDAVICNHWARGGEGAEKLALAVDAACQETKDFKFLYELKVSRLPFIYICLYNLKFCKILKLLT